MRSKWKELNEGVADPGAGWLLLKHEGEADRQHLVDRVNR